MIRLHRPECPNPDALARGDYKHRENKQALKDASHGKCMYCESKVSHIDHGDVEHFRPKEAHPELEFAWDNLGFSCVKCNRPPGKGVRFSDDLLNPYDEDPSEHLVGVGSLLFSKNGSNKGDVSIDIVKLNRADLVEKRNDHLERIRPLLNKYFITTDPDVKEAIKEQLMEEQGQDKEYSLSVASMFLVPGLLDGDS